MKRIWIVVIGAVGGLALGGIAAAAPPPPSEINWAVRPSDAELAGARAKIVAAGRTSGRAVMQCAVGDDGGLSACRLLQETPQGSGYGKALLDLAPKYRRKPPGKDGLRIINVVDAWDTMDTPPDWRRKPTPEQLYAVYPKAAFTRGVGGSAVVSCMIGGQGGLFDCFPVEEAPGGMGFGSAAVALTAQFAMKPATLAGQPVVTMVMIPIVWKSSPGAMNLVGSRSILPPDMAWTDAPSYADVAAAYPPKARAGKIGGHVALSCDMTAEGRLTACQVMSSEPKAVGFDLAAKALAKQFRLDVANDADRKATRSISVHLPVTFDPAMLEPALPTIGKPKWARLPSAEQISAAFAGLKVTGTARTVLACIVQPGGGVGDCKVASEEPTGASVGPAALALAPTFRLSTWTADGLPTVGGTVRIPLRYEGAALQPAIAPK